jgi:AP-3 complex subunit delta-1
MLIKVVKLMTALVPHEPRLARKLLEPLAEIIRTTPAKSLLFECVSTVTKALQYSADDGGNQPPAVPKLVELCAAKLREFVQDNDQNLKYLGLVGFVDLMRSHPSDVSEQPNACSAIVVVLPSILPWF